MARVGDGAKLGDTPKVRTVALLRGCSNLPWRYPEVTVSPRTLTHFTPNKLLGFFLISVAPSLLCHFDEAREQMRLVDFIDFQNNRSSAPPIVMMDGEASEGYLLFWL